MQSLPAPSAPASGESTRARGAKPHHVYSPGCNQPPNVPIGTITEYVPPVPSVFPRQPAPQGIIVDPVGGRMVLFEDPANNVIGTFGPVANQWNKVPHLTIAGGMGTGITAAPNAIWYTGTGGYVFRLDTSPLGYPFGFPVAASKPGTGIDAAPDGHIYIASTAGQIAVLNPKSLPAVTYTPPFAPEGVTTDSSSNAWYTTAGAGKILEEQPAKPAVFKQFKVPSGFGGWGITEGPPGTGVWFTEVDGNRIGNVTASGTVVEYPLPTAHTNPTGIVAACGNLWFTETGSNKIGEITPTGKITEFKVPSAAWTTFGSTQDIAADANGLVWFTEAATGKIASIQTTATVVTTPTPSPTPTATPVPTPTPTPVPTATPTPIATPTPNPYSGVVMADRPSMYFHLDGPLTGTLTDVSGNANNGTVNGALSIAGAIFGWSDTAFELSGGDMYGYYEPTVAAFSVETWLKTTTTATNDVFDGDAGNCPNIFDVRVSDASNAYVPVGVPAGSVSAHIGQGPGNFSTAVTGVLSKTTVNDGSWHHVVATWSAPAGAAVDPSQFHIYIDGQDQTGQTYSYGNLGLLAPITFYSTTAYPATTYCNGNVSGGWGNFNGTGSDIGLDELATYEYALTPAQVLHHYQVGVGLAASLRHRVLRHQR